MALPYLLADNRVEMRTMGYLDDKPRVVCLNSRCIYDP